MSFAKLGREDDKRNVNSPLNINEAFASKIARSSTAASEMQSRQEGVSFTSFNRCICGMTAATSTTLTHMVDGTASGHRRAMTVM